jgi:hypothetical protein
MFVNTFAREHAAAYETYTVIETAIGWNGTERKRSLACFRNHADAEAFVRRVNARPGREGFYYVYSIEAEGGSRIDLVSRECENRGVLEATHQFIATEIALAYTFLSGACLHSEAHERKLSVKQAWTAHDAANAALNRVPHAELEKEITDLARAIAGWSPDHCDDPARIDMYRSLSLRASDRCKPR